VSRRVKPIISVIYDNIDKFEFINCLAFAFAPGRNGLHKASKYLCFSFVCFILKISLELSLYTSSDHAGSRLLPLQASKMVVV
jgi:hypothetical protein